MKKILDFLKLRSVSEWILLCNLVLILLLTLHFDSLNLLLKIEISSLQDQMSHVEHLHEHLNTFQNDDSKSVSHGDHDYFLWKHEKEIVIIVSMTITVLLLAYKFLSSPDVDVNNVNDTISNLNDAVSNLKESVRIMDSDVKEVLKPFEQDTQIFDCVDAADRHVDLISKTTNHNFTNIGIELEQLLDANDQLGEAMEAINDSLNEAIRKTK
jgi:Tfp pilus assembly protein PilO